MFFELSMGWRAESDRHGNWQIVLLHPPGDVFAESPRLADELWGVIQGQGTNLVVLDLAYIELLPSSLMGVMLRIHKRLAQRGGALHLCGLRPRCLEALRVCRLDQVLPVFGDRESAVHGVRGSESQS